MNKNHIAIGILCICFISLIMGIINPKQPDKDMLTQKDNSLFSIDTSAAGNRIALLNIEGPISASTSKTYLSDDFNTDNFLASLEKAEKDYLVKAVIIRINSPGGTVAASQDIYDAVLRLRAKKPVVVSMADVAASGGYYIASAADRIVAQKGTMTGSIGVIMNFADIASLADKIGISSNVIKSGKYKDSGSLYRKMTQDEKNLFQTSINDAYAQFVSAITDARVKRNDKYQGEKRELTVETLKKYADGRVMLGDEAYKLGFVDKIGSQYDAVALASEMVGSPKPLPVVQYNKTSMLKSVLMGVEGKFSLPIKNVLPFSIIHNFQPLMIVE